MPISNFIPKSKLTEYSHLLTSEEVTNTIEQEFNEYVGDWAANCFHDSGDIDIEYLCDLFDTFMSNL